MRNSDVGCRRDQRGMQRGMNAQLIEKQKMEKGDEHPPLIPLPDPNSSPSRGDGTPQSMFRR